MKTTTKDSSANKISRKDALKKAGMYAAFTAAASMVLLAPKVALAQSPPSPGWGQNKAADSNRNEARKA